MVRLLRIANGQLIQGMLCFPACLRENGVGNRLVDDASRRYRDGSSAPAAFIEQHYHVRGAVRCQSAAVAENPLSQRAMRKYMYAPGSHASGPMECPADRVVQFA